MTDSPELSKQWHSISVSEIFERFSSSAAGLTRDEANNRLIKYGRNELLQEESQSFWSALRGQFASIVIWLLIFAAVVAVLMGEIVDSAAILAIILLNAFLGAYQEHSAERAISALQKLTIPHARVRRNGTSELISGPEIVPGDIVELEAGDLVPADARIIEAYSLRSMKSTLVYRIPRL